MQISLSYRYHCYNVYDILTQGDNGLKMTEGTLSLAYRVPRS